MKEKSEEEAKINLEGLPPTRLLFYEDQSKKEFDAKVLKIIDGRYVILDQSAFYGKAGGQQGDTGFINNCHVYDTEKYGNIIVHHVDAPNFSAGEVVHGKIDWDSREQLMRHHTSVHVIHGAAHRILGNHVWQAGANKTVEKAHLDITHFRPIADEELDKIEELANSVVKKSIKINKYVLSREEAEKRYGFTIYQGGAIPHSSLRIIEIPGFDVEACSGTHCDNTKQMDPIVITSTERIQDGIVRINIVSGKAAIVYQEGQKSIIDSIKSILGTDEKNILHEAGALFEKWKKLRKQMEKKLENYSDTLSIELKNKFVGNVLVAEIPDGDMKSLQSLSKNLSGDKRTIILFGVSDKIYAFASAGKDSTANAGEILKKACKELGGNGGGSKNLAQGVGFDKSKLENVIRKIEGELL